MLSEALLLDALTAYELLPDALVQVEGARRVQLLNRWRLERRLARLPKLGWRARADATAAGEGITNTRYG